MIEHREFVYLAEFIRAYDGDTITVDLTLAVYDVGFKIERHDIWRDRVVRLYGIDTPELRGLDRESGLMVRDWVREQLSACRRIVVVTERDKTGKYGRLLGTIYYSPEHRTIADIMEHGKCLNKELVHLGFAVEVDY